MNRWLTFFTLVAAAGISCGDPVHSNAVVDLGAETKGVRTGPEHRPGQPCTVCHGGAGPASPIWGVAGTIYEDEGSATPAVGATVTVVDAIGAKVSMVTNKAGNFYIEQTKYAPTFPLKVLVEADGRAPISMKTLTYGDGGCAECHRGNGSQGRVPSVYLGVKQ